MASGGSLAARLRDEAGKQPAAPALLAAGVPVTTYSGLDSQVRYTAAALRQLGVGPRDRVATLVEDGPEMVALVQGVWAAAVCAPLHPAFTRRELEEHLASLRPRVLIAGTQTAAHARDAAEVRGIPVLEMVTPGGSEAGRFRFAGIADPPACGDELPREDDVALAMHTSGTTSRPKLVLLTHGQLSLAAMNAQQSLELSGADRLLSVMPLFHMHGLMAAVSALLAGGSVVCTRGFNASDFLEALAAFQPTWYSASPALHRAIVDEARARGASVRPHSLRFIRSASAPLTPALFGELEALFRTPVVECYGLTEAPSPVTSNLLPPGTRKPGSVGRPVGADVAVMDESGRLLGAGERGEVVIRGPLVVARYEDNEQANREGFRDGWFRSGDQGYFDGDGYLFLTGRLKDVISRGGEKISPREIEEVLLGHAAVKEAVVFGIPHATLGEDVAAAVVLQDATVTESAIRAFAAARLAAFKVPSVIAIVPRIPAGPTGKLRKEDLAELVGGRVREPGDEPPTGALRQTIARIWGDVLGLNGSAADAHFFLSGGDSLRALRVLARIDEETGALLTVNDIHENPTPAALAALIQQRGFGGGQSRPRLCRRERRAAFPLSSGQQRLWFLEQLHPDQALYNISLALQLSGPLDVARMERALAALIERHEVLRTHFGQADGVPLQSVGAPWRPELRVIPVTQGTARERFDRALEIAGALVLEPFALESGPPVRTVLFDLGTDEHLLVLILHHMLSDSWTEDVLVRDLAAIYDALARSRPPELAPLPVRYSDFVEWQMECARSPRFKSEVAEWIRGGQLQAEVREIRADSPRAAEPGFACGRLALAFPRELSESIRRLSAAESVTPFVTLLAAFHALLAAASGSARTVVGCPFAARPLPETEHVAGFFVNTVLLSADTAGHPGFVEFLRRTAETVARARDYEHVPFEELVKALQPKRSAHRMPLFQAWFDYRSIAPARHQAAGLAFKMVEVPAGRARYDLKLTISDHEDRDFSAEFEYVADLFSHERVTALAKAFEAIIREAVEHPGTPVQPLVERLRGHIFAAAEHAAGRAGFLRVQGRRTAPARRQDIDVTR